MQQVSYHVAVSVDGFIAEPDGGFAAFAMEGDHVEDYQKALRGAGTIIMGRRTYQVALDVGVDDPYPWVPTLVFSRSMQRSLRPNVQVVTSEMRERVASLRAQAGSGVCLVGGAHVAAQLLSARLIDEIVLKINPFVMGAGIRLFEGPLGLTRLEHRSSKVFSSGIVVSTYRVQ